MTKSLRILQVLPELNLGGVERGTLEVAKALVERGHQSFVVSGGGRLVEQLEQEGSKHFTLPIGKKSLFTLRYVKPLRQLISDNKIDIVHVRSRFPAWINKFAMDGIKENRPKLVSTVHGAYSVNAYSKIMLKADKVIATSDFIYNYIVKNYTNVNLDLIKTIYRGVNNRDFPREFKANEKWKEKWYSDFPITKDKFLLCFVGRITRWKGHEDFLKILNILNEKKFSYHAIAVGGYDKKKSSYYQELLDQTKRLNIAKNITFVGIRNDIKEIISISDIAFNLSKKPEPFGRTTLEALSIGTPVIAYEQGGSIEILNHLFKQGLVEANNIDLTVEKIFEISKQHEKINKNTIFTIDNMLNQTLNLYESFS